MRYSNRHLPQRAAGWSAPQRAVSLYGDRYQNVRGTALNGEGFFSSLKDKAMKAAKAIKHVGGKVWDALGSESAANISNIATDVARAAGANVNPLSRPMFPGERHAITGPGAKGGYGRHNWSGPSTAYHLRKARGDLPVNAVDAVSMAHDKAYTTAKTPADVRTADLAAIRGWQRPEVYKEDPMVAKLAIGTFQGFIKAQDAKLMDPMTFLDGPDSSVAKSELAGNGKEKPPPLPGANLRAAVRRAARRHKNSK
jgi:hypothetical protein